MPSIKPHNLMSKNNFSDRYNESDHIEMIFFISTTSAHDDFKESPLATAARNHFIARSKRSLEACAVGQVGSTNRDNTRVRRAALLKSLQSQHNSQTRIKELVSQGISREVASGLTTSHRNDSTNVSSSHPFFPNDAICILTPNDNDGPYYVRGEHIRSDVREGQVGVPLTLILQVIDVNTCEPVPNAYIDLWQSNATGYYGGLPKGTVGFLGTDGKDNLTFAGLFPSPNSTFLRGLQPTDAYGEAQFQTLVPGHYPGRTNHIHIQVHVGGTVFPNNNTFTPGSGTVAHIGQLYFDQDLLDEVEATSHYRTNRIDRLANANDIFLGTLLCSGTDPILRYAFHGDSVEDGIAAWTTLGIDPTADVSTEASYVATLTANGGVWHDNSADFEGVVSGVTNCGVSGHTTPIPTNSHRYG